MRYLSTAMHNGYTLKQIHELTKIDYFYLHRMQNIVNTSKALKTMTVS